MINTVIKLNKFNKNNPLYTLSFSYCKRLFFEKDTTYHSTVSNQYKLVFVLSGKARITTKESTYNLNENDCFMAGRFNKFSLGDCDNTKVYILSFSYDAPLPFFQDCKYKAIEHADVLRPWFEMLYDIKIQPQVLCGVADATVLLLLQQITQLSMSDRQQMILYKKCLTYIEENVHKALTVEGVADAMGYSRIHLARITKACGGKSLKELIDFARIRKLKELARNRYSTEELASKLSFDSPELLRKYFRYQTGQTLASYIRQNAFMKNKE